MRHAGIAQFLKNTIALRGPIALILAEDDVELESTIQHHLDRGFRSVLVLLPAAARVSDALAEQADIITYDVHSTNALATAVNSLIEAAPDQWIYAGYNAEYLFFPFCETRSIGEMLAFHAEERRHAMLTTVIDLYAANLESAPNAVALDQAHFDGAGYYSLTRRDEAADWAPLDRQVDLFGGLRWRFEEHVPWTRRRIDRISLFRAKPGLRMLPDFTLSDAEMNTCNSPWHNNLTAAVCSFRTAKALRTNPGSRAAIQQFMWRNSVKFEWNSQQLMNLGLMEPGQWF